MSDHILGVELPGLVLRKQISNRDPANEGYASGDAFNYPQISFDHGAQRDVGEARQPAPHDRIAGRRIAGAGEITAEPGALIR